ncbi:hypothetical protein GCM10008955_10740 [Deinococcus malanensis]|uniref:Alkyl hydroperoxide reductase subunit C/ Thiol specific antioxidant domain-containing protein n=1 Tax=Deinococcus malanensis TaxID=1706855 RepID=A0ABQ2ENU1_9DEIO|nr:redoxin domain-containing protein [Deinococcus malanensis]GGK19162.1 hypothetical protein GCM10008955_10740 [Deinococcus malanensis]
MEIFRSLGVDVVGVNGDLRKQQVVFRNLCTLNFPIVADKRLALSEVFGVVEEPGPGEDTARPRRETFLVDPEGVIVRHWTTVDPGKDAQTVLEEVRRLLA